MNPQTENKTILILEDEKPLYEIIKAKFETEGFDVVTAKSVSQAFEYMEKGIKVDFIWLDHYLYGEENGLDFVTKIKQKDSPWKNLPIFVISNTASPEKIKKYLKLGVEKCYTKVNFKLGEIVADIKEFLN